MKTRLLGTFALSILIYTCALAGGIPSPEPVVASEEWPSSTRITIRAPYDCYIVKIEISTDDIDTGKKIEIIQATEAILASNPPPATAATPISTQTRTDTTQPQFLKSRSRGSATERTHVFMLQMDRGNDPLVPMKAFSSWFENISWPKGAEVRLNDEGPGIRDPESFRGKLLEEIRNEGDEIKRVFGPNAIVKISGLADAVKVFRATDAEAELSLDHTVEVESK